MARSSPQELARREQRRTYCGLGAMSFQTLRQVVPTTSVTESASAYEALTLFSLGLGVLMQLIARIHTFRWVVLAFVIVTLFILMAIAFATSVLAYSGIGKLMDTIYPRMSRRSRHDNIDLPDYLDAARGQLHRRRQIGNRGRMIAPLTKDA